MEIFFDTEFTDMIGIVCDPALISIGLVSNDRREFYAELSDTWTEGICTHFVIESVLPHLQGEKFKMTESNCAEQLKSWIENFNEEVSLYSDAPNFDWPWVVQLFDKYGWPENMARKCGRVSLFDTETVIFRYNNAIEEFWSINKAKGASKHHALWDARSIQFAWDKINKKTA